MAVSSFARAFPSFECRSDPDFSRPEIPSAGCAGKSKPAILGGGAATHGLSSLIMRFPPNFVRQLSNKARRNCSNIGVAQVVAASWSNNQGASGFTPAAKAVDAAAAAAAIAPVEVETGVEKPVVAAAEDPSCNGENVQLEFEKSLAFAFAQHYTLLKNGKRRASFEYGRYGNYTTVVAEEKISALEGAESTILMASGMCASTVMLLALVPAGGHLVTTTDCYRKTRIFIETFLPKMGITATVIDPADIEGLESALEKNNVSVTLFFTESPTNPFLRCVDIERVSKLCHDKGALVCIDGTFATPLNQKALALGADLVVHSATKYIGGHNDVLGGSISGPEKLISVVRNLHHVLGGALNPNAAYSLIRGMKTLHLRVQQQNSTAQRMAEILEAHPKIRRVYYPGLASHPEHELAKKQMNGFGGVVSFEVDGDLHITAKFVGALKIPYIAPSFGGVESIVDQPAIMSYWDLSQSDRAKYGILDNLVRYSFGVEDFEDLKSDILQALEAI
ncbi:hypothetical protein DH2020_009322 [Rehmannia glutinosa]|uniref:Cystathionine gamma-synthase n=1 Tax=Rehmannia glutinosa TaxID=99300 RepID=A0ABR0X948_REHGL